jgi:hypothetical protein
MRSMSDTGAGPLFMIHSFTVVALFVLVRACADERTVAATRSITVPRIATALIDLARISYLRVLR